MSDTILKALQYAQKAYSIGKPIMTDEVFDNLATMFGFYEVGHIDETVKNRIKHKYRMYSLQKVYDEEDSPTPGYIEVETPKLDGAAISLLYIDGLLNLALTRGNGIEGEDITDKALLIPSIPNRIEFNEEIQITGELVANKDIPKARNYVSGALFLKDMDEFISRDITFIAYGINPIKVYESYTASMQLLSELTFNTVIDSSWLEFPQDGKVYRIDDNRAYDKLGHTSKHPRGAYARKLSSDVAIEETTLTDVLWQVGKSGKITPVAIFNDITIDGANINRATLHNVKFIEDMDLYIGDTILVTRSGGIIPKVLGKL